MRKYLIFVFLLVILIPINYNATSGALASGSIKTCPNGKLYGKHTNHWHKAVKRGNRYYASGSALKKDPCPPKSDNNDLKSLTIDGNEIMVYYDMKYETYNKNIKIKAVPSDSKAKVSTDYKGLTVGKNNINITVTAQNGEKEVYKLVVTLLESNLSLKSLKVNDDDVEISSNMSYETTNKDINITAIPSENDVKVSNNYKSLVEGDNKITITLTDSYGNKKDYLLNVILKKKDISLNSLTIDNNEIELSNDMSYETYNKNIVIKAIPNDESIKVSNNLKELVLGNNEILITLLDELGNKKEYKINIILKERNISLDYLKINNEIVEINDNITYETYSDDIIIDAGTNEEGIKVTNDYRELSIGSNIITITLSDDYGNKKDYTLNVIKLEKEYDVKEENENDLNNDEIVPNVEEEKKEKNETKSNDEDDTSIVSKIVGGLGGIAAVGGASYAVIKRKK